GSYWWVETGPARALLKLIADATEAGSGAPGGCDKGRRRPCPDTREHCPKFQRARRVHHVERLPMSDSPLQHMRRIFGNVEGINEAELRRQLGELVCCAGVVSL
ncbi:unnamed protein product, partial [Ectocarpus sp. 12 AP-2014]